MVRTTSVLALCAVCAGAVVVTASASRVHVRVTDGDVPVAARVYISQGGESLLPAGFPRYDKGAERHILVDGAFDLDLHPGTYRLRVERGLEYEPVDTLIEVPRRIPVEIRLRRWAELNRDGWYSADMHVHRDPADVPLILEAEDLNFVPAITTHVWSTEVSQPWKGPARFPVIVAPTRMFTANAQEIERIQGGPGAVILLGPDLPLPFTGYELYPPAAAFARVVHERGGFVDGDKPFWVDTFVNAALGHIDAIQVNCNHFVPRSVETDLVPWSHWPVEFGYRGDRGFALWMMDLYYRMLDAGIELPLSAGSASGVKETPVGFNRVYAYLGARPMGYDAFIAGLEAGRTFTTNGPIVDLEVDGRYVPGDRIAVEPGHDYTIRARARYRGPLERLELVANGAVVGEAVARGHERALAFETTLSVGASTWLAVRVFAGSPPRESWQRAPQVFAHTSPVYLLVDGAPVVVPASVRDLLEKLDVLVAQTERERGFRIERDRQETLDLYREARAVLAARLAQHP